MIRISAKRISEWALTAALGGALLFGVPALERMTSAAPQPPAPGQMSLYVFDVGQGDAILAEEGDRQILIDGGPDSSILAKLGEVMPPGDRAIELVVLTHPHSDHVTGLVSVLKSYSVGRVMMTDAAAPSAIDREFVSAVARLGVPVDDPAAVAEEAVGGMKFRVLNYGNAKVAAAKHKGSDDGLNDSSIVGMLAFGNRRFLLTGDASAAIEDRLLASEADLHADFLKVGHHGSAYSTGDKFLGAAHPAYAAISLGSRNAYGFPAGNLLARLKAAGTAILRTDSDGDIVAVTDGLSLQAKAEKVK